MGFEKMESTARVLLGYKSEHYNDKSLFNISNDNLTLFSNENIFVKPGPLVYYSIGGLMTCVMIVGFTANLSVLYAYAKVRQIRTTDNTLVIGLALSDIGQSILGIPFVVIACFSGKWIFGHVVCQFYAFITTSLGISQITTLTLIATERYFIIVQHNRRFSNTQRNSATVMVCSFLYGSAWATGPLLGWSNYKEEEIGIACCVTWEVTNAMALSYTISLCTFGWLLPLTLITYGYISIALSIRGEQTKRQYLRSSASRNKNSARERKVAITILIMIGAFVVSWMPYSIVSLWSAFGDFHSIPLGVQVTPAIFAKCSIIWNPLIYVARHKHFRRGVKKSVPCVYAFLKNRTLTSDSKQDKPNSHYPQRKLSFCDQPEHIALEPLNSESRSSIATINKSSIARSTRKTSSVWFDTPPSVEKMEYVADYHSSSEADSIYYDDIISDPNMFQTTGTQTDTTSALTADFKQYLQKCVSIQNTQSDSTEFPVGNGDSDCKLEPARNRAHCDSGNSFDGCVNLSDRREMLNEIQYHDEKLYCDKRSYDLGAFREKLVFELDECTQYEHFVPNLTRGHVSLIKKRERPSKDSHIRHKSLYRISSEPINGEYSFLELTDSKPKSHDACADNEHSKLIRQSSF